MTYVKIMYDLNLTCLKLVYHDVQDIGIKSSLPGRPIAPAPAAATTTAGLVSSLTGPAAAKVLSLAAAQHSVVPKFPAQGMILQEINIHTCYLETQAQRLGNNSDLGRSDISIIKQIAKQSHSFKHIYLTVWYVIQLL